jgi:tetratricopeptide (TPR) repeat protein
LNRTDAGSLYDAARHRAVAAAVIEQAAGADAPRLARDEADRAMAWLTRAVAAGYKNAARMTADKDLDALRRREDFKQLLARLLEEDLSVRTAKLGPDHPNTLKARDQLAVVYWSAKRLDRSVPLFEEGLKLREAKLGRRHADTLLTVANLGVNYRDAGRLADALPLLEEGYRASKQHASLRWVGTALLDAYVKAGRAKEAVPLVDELAADARELLPKDSPQLAVTLASFGVSLLELKAFAAAEGVLRECLLVREKTQPDAWTTFNARSMLGGSLLGQGRFAEAEPLLLAGYEGMKQRAKAIPPQGSARLPEAADRLVGLYAVWGKPAERRRWQAERAKYPPEAAPMPREAK